MIMWMLWAVGFGALTLVAALASEKVAGVFGVARRQIWMVALVAAAVVPPLLATRTVTVKEPTITLVEEFPASPPTAKGNPGQFARPPIVRTTPPGETRVESAGHSTQNRTAIALWAITSLMIALVFVRTMLRLRRESAQWPEISVGEYRALLAPNAGPAVVGFTHPRIVLPEWALSLEAKWRELMLCHEAEHIRVRDPRTVLIAGTLLVLFPWNVAMWVIVRQLRRAMELDCDARVIRALGDASTYGRVLLTVGERFTAPLPLGAPFSGPRPLLEERIEAMSAPRFRRPLRAALPFVALVLLATMAATRAPHPAPLGPLAFATQELPSPRSASSAIPVTRYNVSLVGSPPSVRPVRTRIDSFGATQNIGAPTPPPIADRDRALALARQYFPAVVRGDAPADFILMLFDDHDAFLRGFHGQGQVMIHIAGDSVREDLGRAQRKERDLTLFGASGVAARFTPQGKSASQSTDAGAFTGYLVGIGPWTTRGMVSFADMKTTNTADGLSEVSHEGSGIAGISARNIVHVDLYPLGERPRERDVRILAVHLNQVQGDTAHPGWTRVNPLPANAPAQTTQPRAEVRSFDVGKDSAVSSYDIGTDGRQVPVRKRSTVKQLVILPVPIPPNATPYTMEACFEVAPNGDAKLLSFRINSHDADYNRKVDSTLRGYRFNPGTLNGVPVRDTSCVKAVMPPKGGH